MGTRVVRGAMAVAVAVILSSGPARGADPISGVRPAEPQPAADQLTPGLAVQYAYAVVNHLDELKGKKFEAGPPLTHLDWKMGTGIVLTSKQREGVGATINGLIQFEKAGLYAFEITSNDGVRMEVGGKLIHEDPGVHADTTSDRIGVKIDQAGWYPVTILYFQKRNTATLVVRWVEPGGKPTAIPAKALAHKK
jgi:PA14 domain-containing protein